MLVADEKEERRAAEDMDPVTFLMKPRPVHVGAHEYTTRTDFIPHSSDNYPVNNQHHCQQQQLEWNWSPQENVWVNTSASIQRTSSTSATTTTFQNYNNSTASGDSGISTGRNTKKQGKWPWRNRLAQEKTLYSSHQNHHTTTSTASGSSLHSSPNPYQRSASHPRNMNYPQYVEYLPYLSFPHTPSEWQHQHLNSDEDQVTVVTSNNYINNSEEIHTPTDLLFTTTSSISQEKTKVKAKDDDVKKENDVEEVEEGDVCIICMEKPKNASLIHGDTAHLICCIGCANVLKKNQVPCPVCRQDIQLVVRNYYC